MPESLPSSLLDLRRCVEELNVELARWDADLPEGGPVPPEWRARVRSRSQELGLHGMTQPVDLGGSAAGPLALTVVREELTAAHTRLGDFVLGPSPGILTRARGEARTRYLEPVLRGEKRGAFAFTEPRDAARPTEAHYDGDHLVVNGRKGFVTGGADADFYNALVNIRSDERPSGTAMLAIERETEGVEILERFQSLEGSHHVSVGFRDVRVPSSHIIGEVGEGLGGALRNISDVRLAIAARAVGHGRFVTERAVDDLRAPHRTGAPLGEHESIRLRYADMRIEVYAARSMLYRTARLCEGDDNVINEVAATKIFCTETAGRVVDQAIQLAGGRALVEGHPYEALYRQVRSLRLAEGASDLLRLNVAKGRLELDKGRL